MPGWLLLGEVPGPEMVFGAVGTFWKPNITWHELTADQFAGFEEPGWGKITGTLLDVPSWKVSGSANHPWVLKLPGDADWTATVTAERLEVTGDGTLVFFDFGVVALVIQSHQYSFVSQIGWDGLSGDT